MSDDNDPPLHELIKDIRTLAKIQIDMITKEYGTNIFACARALSRLEDILKRTEFLEKEKCNHEFECIAKINEPGNAKCRLCDFIP